MLTHNGKVSERQVRRLLILQMFNSSLLILPRVLAYEVGQDGYWVIPIAFLFSLVYIGIILKLTLRFKGDTFVELTQKVLSKPIGIIISLVLMAQLIMSTALELRMFGEVVGRILLPKTPIIIVMLVMLFAVAYLVKSGIEATGRMAELLVYFVFIPLIMVMILIIPKANYRSLMPILEMKGFGVLRGAYFASLVTLPIETLLMLTGLMSQPKKAYRASIRAIGLVAILEVVLIIITFSGIGIEESKRHIWPVLLLMRSVQFPGSFIENQEILMMMCWVLSIYIHISCGIYFSTLIGARICKLKRENLFVLPLIPILYFLAMIPTDLIEVYTYYITFQRQFGIYFLLPVPLIIWVIAKVRKVGELQ